MHEVPPLFLNFSGHLRSHSPFRSSLRIVECKSMSVLHRHLRTRKVLAAHHNLTTACVIAKKARVYLYHLFMSLPSESANHTVVLEKDIHIINIEI